MKTLFTVVVLALFVTAGSAQTETTQSQPLTRLNSLQLEAGGHAGYYSLNYERILINAPKFKTSVQAGVAYYPTWTNIITLWIPVAANGIFALKDGYHLEAGLGHSFIYEDLLESMGYRTAWGGFFTGRLGVRYQQPDSRLLVRAGGVLFMEYPGKRDITNTYEFHLLPGVALGYCF